MLRSAGLVPCLGGHQSRSKSLGRAPLDARAPAKYLAAPLLPPNLVARFPRTQPRHVPASGFNIGSLMGSSTTTTAERAQWWKVNKELWVECSTLEDFEREVINAPEGTLVAIGCQKSYPELCKVAARPELRENFKFVKICIDNLGALARKSGITALPRMSVHKAGEGTLITMDATFSQSKNLAPALKLIASNPDKSFVLDPNGIPMAVAKVVAQKVMEKKAEDKVMEKKAEDVQQLQQNTESLHDHLARVASSAKSSSSTNGSSSKATDQAVNTTWPMSLGLGFQYIQDKNKFMASGLIDKLYPSEVAVRMKPKEHYMDYTGSSVYCQSQLDAVFDDLKKNMYGNPHSANPSSSFTSDKIEEARLEILRFFNADPAQYQVVFTRSATGALKMVGETFPWDEGSKFRYLRENHNSVLGIREYALVHGLSLRLWGQFQAVAEDLVESWLSADQDPDMDHIPSGEYSAEKPAYSLFAFPAEDNFAGVKYPLSWIEKIKAKSKPEHNWIEKIKAKSTPEHKWLTLLDAAAYAPTQPLDLSELPVDFVDVAFYKMFGFPTGLGALLVQVDAVPLLKKVFWGGGTVALSTSKDDFHVLKCRPSDKMEDGTLSFLDILALTHGFQMLKKLGGVKRVQSHTAALTDWTYNALSNLKHPDGKPVLKIFGKHDAKDKEVQGPIFNFNVMKADGSVYSYKAFEREAAEAGFHVRTGAECNPGACYSYLGVVEDVESLAGVKQGCVDEKDVESLAGVKEGCEDDVEFVTVQRPSSPLKSMDSGSVMKNIADSAIAVGHPAEVAMKWVQVPLGSVRVSLGYMSTFEDCWALVDFIQKNYVGK
eukprot:gene24132-9714_t